MWFSLVQFLVRCVNEFLKVNKAPCVCPCWLSLGKNYTLLSMSVANVVRKQHKQTTNGFVSCNRGRANHVSHTTFGLHFQQRKTVWNSGAHKVQDSNPGSSCCEARLLTSQPVTQESTILLAVVNTLASHQESPGFDSQAV